MAGALSRQVGAGLKLIRVNDIDVTGLLDALSIERTRFIGLSMGGMIALQLALLAPHTLKSWLVSRF